MRGGKNAIRRRTRSLEAQPFITIGRSVNRIAKTERTEQKPIHTAWAGGSQAPTCCHMHMQKRVTAKGAFFSCVRYPHCRRTVAIPNT